MAAPRHGRGAARRAPARAMLAGIDPGEGIEGMLACQMVAAHEASPEQAEQNLKHAERLMALYTRQVEVLDRHRVREAERQDRLKREREAAERQAFRDSVAPTPRMVWESLMAFAQENDPDWDGEEDDEYDVVYFDLDGTCGPADDDQAADGGPRDSDAGDPSGEP